MKRIVVSLAVLLSTVPASAQNAPAGRGTAPAAQEAAPPAPAPGSAGIFKSNADLQAVLKKAIAGTNDMATSAIATPTSTA